LKRPHPDPLPRERDSVCPLSRLRERVRVRAG
jgi:hypothetical protein